MIMDNSSALKERFASGTAILSIHVLLYAVLVTRKLYISDYDANSIE